MVKLLRLTSNDNCKFNVNMDADLIVDSTITNRSKKPYI